MLFRAQASETGDPALLDVKPNIHQASQESQKAKRLVCVRERAFWFYFYDIFIFRI